jgi:hypothetical protein
VALVRGQPGLRQLSPGNVSVLAGKTTSVTMTLDTGIHQGIAHTATPSSFPHGRHMIAQRLANAQSRRLPL